MLKTIVRFAPSITGPAHPGTLYNCLLNYIFARQNNGTFFLRLDGQHLTPQRIRFQRELQEDFERFGFKFDFVVKQSDRVDIYQKKIRELINHSSVYFCDCTKADIAKRGNSTRVFSLERFEKYPPPSGIKQIIILNEQGDNITPLSEISASSAKGFSPESVADDKSSCWKPYDVGYFGDIKPVISFKWKKPVWIQGVRVDWANLPLKRYRIFADRREIAEVRKANSYYWTEGPFKDEISFPPVECQSLELVPIEFMKNVKIEYYYDRFCRNRGLSLDFEDKQTVIRKKCHFPLDVALYFDRQPDLCLTSAIDDKEFQVTHSIRGIDIQPFTLLEREAGSLIGYSAHNLFHGMILDRNDYKLSKFTNSKPAIDYLQEMSPEELLSLLAFKAGLINDKETRDLDGIVKNANLDRVFGECRNISLDL